MVQLQCRWRSVEHRDVHVVGGLGDRLGDGSATEAIGAFNPGDAPVTHTYAGDASSYTVTLAEADGSCSIEGHFFASAPVSDFGAAR